MRAVSVVIPAYNAASTITRAIKSVLLQDIGDLELEIIVVDDGSQDATASLVESSMKLSRQNIRLIRQENSGPAAARNTGVSAAKGEYIAFLDADDQWLPGKLKAQVQALDDYPEVALVCTPMNGRRFRPRSPRFRIRFRSLLWSNRVYTSSVLLRKQTFFDAGGFNPTRRLSEDYELWLKIAAKSSILAINKPLLHYSKSDGISSKLWLMEKGELETYRILRKGGLLSNPAYIVLRYWSLAKYFLRFLFSVKHT